MPLIADLIDPAAAERLAAAVRDQGRQRQAAEAATPVQATCPACGQPRPVPAAVFRSGAEHPHDAERADLSRARTRA